MATEPPGAEAGDRAPGLSLQDCDGKPWTLAAALEGGPVLLVFFRGAWCFLSRRALAALRAAAASFASQGCTLAAAAPESVEKLFELRRRLKLDFALLSDEGAGAAQRFAVPIERRFGCPFPAVFLIGPDGCIEYRHVGRGARDWPDWPSLAKRLAGAERQSTPRA